MRTHFINVLFLEIQVVAPKSVHQSSIQYLHSSVNTNLPVYHDVSAETLHFDLI